MSEQYYKYNVILLNCINNEMTILFTCNVLSDAIQRMNTYVDNNFVIDSINLKCYHENTKSINIYKYYYFHSKTLINKLQILEFVCDAI
jgi:hypothetical protein